MSKIQHTVLFKFPDLDEASENKDEMDMIVKKFDSLEGISAKFAKGEGSDGWTHCLFVIADTSEALKAYLHHDYHLKEWMNAVKPFGKGIIVFDSELAEENFRQPIFHFVFSVAKCTHCPKATVKPHLGSDFLASVNWPDKAGGFTYLLSAAFPDSATHKSFVESSDYASWLSSCTSPLVSFSCSF
uniref:Stress-response A/B barrel domain-containing protein n=1 Tax=Aureoumbra lagunensis TaxID=44058 RepID=A0A7S3K6H5_9STRA|mmetsp:Transcript_8811/g.13526  ORF Transcript_8811/g.13526 Transcript_8811/m.13526 type:complete len:186 (+) Transcript_8811:31-588(+)